MSSKVLTCAPEPVLWCGVAQCGVIWKQLLPWGVSSHRVDSQVISISSVQSHISGPSHYKNDGLNEVLSIFWYWFSSVSLALDMFGSYFWTCLCSHNSWEMKFLHLRKAEILIPPFGSAIWDIMKNILGGVGTRLMLKRYFGNIAGCLLSYWSFIAWKMRLLRCGQSCGVVTVVPTEQKSWLLILYAHDCRKFLPASRPPITVLL